MHDPDGWEAGCSALGAPPTPASKLKLSTRGLGPWDRGLVASVPVHSESMLGVSGMEPSTHGDQKSQLEPTLQEVTARTPRPPPNTLMLHLGAARDQTVACARDERDFGGRPPAGEEQKDGEPGSENSPKLGTCRRVQVLATSCSHLLYFCCPGICGLADAVRSAPPQTSPSDRTGLAQRATLRCKLAHTEPSPPPLPYWALAQGHGPPALVRPDSQGQRQCPRAPEVIQTSQASACSSCPTCSVLQKPVKALGPISPPAPAAS